jgi:hypothetical protein
MRHTEGSVGHIDGSGWPTLLLHLKLENFPLTISAVSAVGPQEHKGAQTA